MTHCDIAVIGGGPEAMAAVSHLAWRNAPNVIWIAPDDPLEADRHLDSNRWGLSRSGETATAVEFEELRKKIDIRIGATAWGAFPDSKSPYTRETAPNSSSEAVDPLYRSHRNRPIVSQVRIFPGS
ncbi:MAG: hypothetical protein R2845_03650 [Thermomicrobiales bacterium]